MFNIGNLEEISIAGLAELIKAETASRSPIVKIPYDQAYEAGFEDMPRRVPDLRKMHDFIGYVPEVGLADIIKAVVADQRLRVNVHT